MKHLPVRRSAVIAGLVSLSVFALFVLLIPPAHVVRAQTTFTQGVPIANLSPLETTLFNSGFIPFNKIWDPQGGGLGPVFTQDQCSKCHSDPGNVAGGNSTMKVEFVGKINSDGTYNDLSTNPNEGGPQIQPM